MRSISIDQARRYALAAQGFTEARPTGRVDVRHFRRVLDRVLVIQLDSVNVFSRAHYMPFFSRLGAYERAALDRWLWRSGEMFEYWGHMASVLPVNRHPLFRWRMERGYIWTPAEKVLATRPGYLDAILEEVRERGPLQTSDLEDPGIKDPNGSMWNWSDGKVALEMLFVQGRVAAAHRRNFVRMYDLAERVIPLQHLEAPAPPAEEAQAILLQESARALGVATADDLADYFRIRMPMARPIIKRLAAEGSLLPVEVRGWDRPAFLHPEARLPRSVESRALLSPFDNLIWYRDRVERLWDFFYRIEIYVPEPKRIHGYYVLPFLLDGDLVARVDLKTDRKAGALLVKGAFAEPGVDLVRVGRELGEELGAVAGWLGLGKVDVSRNGDLAGFLT
ncbi:MAG TPA: crosslink repair DNA glycosylase YcaQ family protein [Acidimicrobiia bacterium]|nr:crosslink repair DNA glycosylase YcaQ family protein [Acidimicrobiia bacterium]